MVKSEVNMNKEETKEAVLNIRALADRVKYYKARGWNAEEIHHHIGADLETVKRVSRFLDEISIVRFGKAVLLCAALSAVSGCGLFMRDFEIPGVLKLTFPEGIDVHAGTNSIDRVDDRRGVSPIVEQRSGLTNK